MMKNALFALAALGSLVAVAMPPGVAHARDLEPGLERLGVLRADFTRDTDELEVEFRNQRYWGLRFSAESGEIFVDDVEVRFYDGTAKSYTVRRTLDTRSPDLYLDLDSDEGRGIREISVVHRTQDRRQERRARLLIDGEIATPPPPAQSLPHRGYERISVTRLRPGAESVDLDIGREEGRFAQLRFRPIGGRLRIAATRVVYGNGETDRDRFQQNLRDGEASDALDLEGRRRAVRKVTLALADHRFGQSARWVEVWGTRRVDRGDQDGGRGPDRPEGFDEIGALRVGSRPNTERVSVPRGAGRIDTIGLVAEGRPVSIGTVVVRFDRGDARRYRVERILRPRDGLLRLDLGDDRRVDAVDVEYRGMREDDGRGIGRLVLLAERDRRGPGRPGPGRDDARGEWELIGTKRAAMLSKDNDAIQLTRQDGRFRAIRIAVKRQDIRFYGMVITYGNGQTETVPISGWVREGSVSEAFDLKGRERFIKEIAVRYRSRLGLQGSGIIEVYGLR